MKKKNNRVAEHWNKNAELWAREIRAQKDVFRELFNNPAFLTFVGDIKGKKVLDACCGEGNNTRMFAAQGAQVTGVDFSENMIRLAQEEEQKNPLGITYHVASIADLSLFKDNSFDKVLSFMALMDCDCYAEALREFYRVLKPQGALFFNVTHPCFFTSEYRWVKDEQGNKTQILVGNYFAQQPWEFTFHLAKDSDKSDAQPFTTINYHRTLSTYINTLLETGFVLKRVEEPRPSEQACKINSRLICARDIAASFLYVHVVKPR